MLGGGEDDVGVRMMWASGGGRCQEKVGVRRRCGIRDR